MSAACIALLLVSRDYEGRARDLASRSDRLGYWNATARVQPLIQAMAACGAALGVAIAIIRL